ncbi:MAG: Ig-like domain-containing protein [Tenuifilaceae bacterium]
MKAYFLRALPKFLFLLFSIGFISNINIVNAQEGTKQLMPNSNDRLWLEFNVFSGNNFGNYLATDKERIYIYLNAGEKMYFGMKMYTASNYGGNVLTNASQVTFRIKNPSGTVVFPQQTMVTSGNGYISTYVSAVTGPNGAILNGTTISGGYNALSYTAVVSGNHYIEFNATAAWPNYRTRFALEFFDVTVTDATNHVKTNPGEPNKSSGRLWSKGWTFTNTSFTSLPVNAYFYVFTSDEFINKVNFRMYPYSFTFVVNSYGVKTFTEQNYVKRAQSLDGDQTTGVDISEYRVFLNDPDRSVWPNTKLVPPKVQVWAEGNIFMDYYYMRNPLYLPLDITQVVMEKNMPSCPYEDITIFKIEANNNGFTAILIDVDKDGVYSANGSDKVIYRNMKKGLNYVLWNFTTDAGAVVAAGDYNASATFLGRGPANFPLYDVEQMDGLTTSSIRPFNKLKTTNYWDDSQITTWGDPTGLMDETQQKQLVIDKVVPRIWSWRDLPTTPHNGNMNTLNTWFHALDLGYSSIGLRVQESTTKCVDGLAPWVGDIYKEGPKNTNLVFATADFTFKFFDPREYALSSIQVLSLPTNGVLKLSGVNVTVNQIITSANLPNITYTPNTNWFGKDNFLWKAYNGERWSNNQEKVYLIINTPPVISDIPDQVLCTNTPTGNIPFTIQDDENDVNTIEFTGFSADPTFVPNTGIAVLGSGTNRTVSVTPIANRSGMAIIYIMADDGLSQVIEEFTVYVGPDLEFSGDTTLCVGDPLYLVAQETGAAYSWKYNGTEISTTQSVSQAAGSVNVGPWSLTVIKSGCTSSRNFTVSVSPLTTFVGDVNICVGEALSLSATEVNATYIWSKGTTTVSTSKIFSIPSTALTDAGTDYTLFVNKDGCTNTSPQFAVSVINPPNTGLGVTGNTVDPGKNGAITITLAQNGIIYNVYQGTTFVATGTGADANLVITVPSTFLLIGNNTFIVKADNGNCEIALTTSPVILVNTPGITVSLISGNTSEAGGTATFTLKLNTEPSANVGIALTSSDLTEGTVAPANVTFTTANYSTPQIITVTGVNDDIIDGNISYTINTAAASSTDLNYNGVDAVDVTVINTDNDVAGVAISPVSGLTTTEAGGTATFTAILACQPSADVTIGISSSDISEGTVSPISLTFNSTNWNVAQTVTITGVNDNIDDDNVGYNIITTSTSSTDVNFNGLTVSDVSVTNTDNDIAGITVNPTSGLTTTEAGGQATFTIVLNTEPTSGVSIDLSSSDVTEGSVSPSNISFSIANWSTPQTVTITGLNDNIDDDNIAYTITTNTATSTDNKYNGVNPSDVSITNTDDDAAGITVSPTSGLTTTEAGGTATFNVVLTSQPIADVTIGISSNDITEGTVSVASIVFTSSDWSSPKTITITGVNDDIDDDNIGYSIITAQATGSDGKYNIINPVDVTVSNTDDDIAGLTISKSNLTTTEVGGNETFTVRLNTQPASNITIGITSSNLNEGTVSPSSLTFTTANWNSTQIVTVTGVDDYVVDGNVIYTVTVSISSGDSKYSALSNASITATNIDNDNAGVTVTPTSIGTTEAGGTGIFSLVLTSQPLAIVTISFSGVNSAEGSIDKTSVTFNSTNWNIPQNVTVTGIDDAISDGNISYTIITVATSTYSLYNGIAVADVIVTNADNDVAGITVSPTSLTTNEGGSNTFTIALNTQPTADVTITISSLDVSEGTVSPSSVTFTNSNWAAKTITVTGVNDDLDDGNISYTIQTGSAVSTDLSYGGVNPSDVTVTNVDDDNASILVTPTSGLTTTEAGGTATFTLVLTTQPTANVTIGISSSDLTEGTVSPASIVFTPTDWSTPKTVTVTGVNDDIDDDFISYTILTAQATGLDGNYNIINPSDVTVTNTDNDVAGITVTPTSGLTTTEAGGTATFTVVLTSQPTADVTIGLSSSNIAEGTVSPASLVFTSINWNIPKTVTITGVNDDIDDDNINYTIITAQATSSDSKYSVINPSDVSVTNTDNDVTGITVTPTTGLTTTEAGGTATFTVRLNTQPTADVTIGLSSSNTSEGTITITSITFTTLNWNTAQTITINGVDDIIDDDNVVYNIITSTATSSDSKYNGINAADVSVTNTDNDVASITVSPTSGLTTTEAGGTATFTIVLNTQPIANVNIPLGSNDATEGSVLPSNVIFSTANWSTPQTLTITGLNDNIDDDNILYSITTSAATSADSKYNGINPADVSVTNIDDDVAGITVAPTTGLTTTEAGGTTTFTVVLNTQPATNVTIGLSSSNTNEGTVSPSSLTFNTTNWSSAQTVTIAGVNDFIDDGNIIYTIVTAPASSTDSKYSSLNGSDVSVTNTDNDDAGIIVTPIAGLYTRENSITTTFTVRLNSQPTANVVIGLSSSNTNEGTVSPSSLTFSVTNWNTAQTVTVTGANDFVDDGDIAYTINTSPATSTDLLYNNLDASNVSITNQDDDAAGITVNPVNLTINEEGVAKTFTMVLNSQPTQNVTIAISSDNINKGTVLPASITFTTLSWNVPQVITVTPVDNFVDDGDEVFTIVTDPATSLDENYLNRNASDITVTSIDNEAADIIISTISGATNENLTTATFTVKLSSQPLDDVTLGISSSDITEGTVLPISITFTSANWNTAQTVTVTGVDDVFADGNQVYYIQFDPAISTDDNYNGIDPDDIILLNSDNDSPGVTVFQFTGLITTEAGGTATFSVTLNSLPAANVDIAVSSSDITEGTASPSTITFTPADWNTLKTITITGVDDLDDDGNIAYTVDLANTVSTDASFNGLDVQDASVTNRDDVGPRPFNDAATTDEDTETAIDVLANDKGLDNGGIALSISQQPSHGTVVVNVDKTITYKPNGLFNGNDTFIYRVCDATSACNEATVNVTVTGVDDLPIAVNDSRGASKNTSVIVDVLFNDYGMDDGGIIVAIEEAPAQGNAVANLDNTVTYTPALNLIGTITFKYRITDADGDFSIAQVTINVREVNSVPNAINDVATTTKNTSVDISVLANDTGLNDGFGKLSIQSNPSNGSVVVNSNRTITFTPTANYTGNDSFQYLIEDIDGDYDIATVSITITEQPDNIPVANADRRATEYETAVTIDVLSNDTGLEDGIKSIIISASPVNGSVVVNPDFTVTYTPNNGFSGTETFGYQVSDNDDDRATATVTITVLPDGVINHIPVAMDDAATTTVNTPVSVNVLSNDTGLEDGFGGLSIRTAPLHGTVTVNANRTITYTPSNFFVGSDSFVYLVEDVHGDYDLATVAITVTDRPNYAPVANDDRRGTEYETAVTVDVLVNDTGLDDGGIAVTLTTAPAAGEGTAVVNGDNTITFTPATGFSGTAAFGYTVQDIDGDSDNATVTITVLPDGVTNHIPVAVDDAATTILNTAVTINVLANDTGLEDGYGDLLVHRSPLHGTATVNANRTITYTPSNMFIGSDNFQYWVEDVHGDYDLATVAVTVTDRPNYTPSANDDRRGTEYETPVIVDVLINDTGLEDGGIKVTLTTAPPAGEGAAMVNGDNTITFTPSTGFSGVTTFGYTVEDRDGDSDNATVTITVLPDGVTNHIPVANDDVATTIMNTSLDINVLINDTGLEDGYGDLVVHRSPLHGTATVNSNRTITYTPSSMFIGSDSFQYWVEDVHGDYDLATVAITVTDRPNYAPVANDDRRGTEYETAVTVDVLVNDTGLDDGGIAVTLTTAPAAGEGTAVVNGDNTITFTPATGFSGTAAFGYTVQDMDGDSDNATVTITVLPDGVTNHIPVAVDDAATTILNTAVTINVLANDTGLEDGYGDLLVHRSPLHGTATVNANRTITYTPSNMFIGSDNFQYWVEDVHGDYDLATVAVTVTDRPNYTPSANDDRRGTEYETPVIVDVLINDTGLEDGGIKVTLTTAPPAGEGAAMVNGDNTITFTPSTGFSGVTTFGYTVEDRDGDSDNATVTITVLPDGVTNHIPVANDDVATTIMNTSLDINVLINDTGLEDGYGDLVVHRSPLHGTATVNSNRTITYTPSSMFIGSDSFQYWVEDVHGDYDLATVAITVTDRPNYAPVANDDRRGTEYETAVTVDVLVNDTGLDDGGIAVTLTTAPAAGEGTAVVNGDNTITFTPATGFSGTAAFGYTVQDMDGDSDNATVTITVLPDGVTNHIPVAVDDAATTIEGNAVTINVLANDTNLDDGIENIAIYSLPKFGTVVINSNLTVTYTPIPMFIGLDSFEYLVSDTEGDYDIAVVSITVTAKQNSIPNANDDSRGTKLNTNVVVDVLVNDTGLDDGGLVLTINSNPTQGTVVVNADNTITYSPNVDYLGVDNFIYQICDIDNECSTATVTINVKENNFVPLAVDDKFFTNINTTRVLNVLDNDTGLDDGGIIVELLNQTIAGQVTVNSDNTITYIPLTGFEGTDNFAYKVTDIDGDYDIANVTVVVTSGTIPGYTLTSLAVETSENETNATVSVSLSIAPVTDVSISFISDDLTEGVVSPASLTFTSSNWNIPQVVTITGVNDFIIDGSILYNVKSHIIDVNSDDDFDSLSDQVIVATNTDNDVAGFTLSKTTAITSERGVNDNFTVVLNVQPYSNVLLGIVSADLTEGEFEPDTLTFTTANWNIPQQVLLSGINDYLIDGNITYNINIGVLDEGSDDNFDPLDDQIVVVTNLDNSLPVAVNDENLITEGEIDISGNILGNDTDADNDILSVSEINSSTDFTTTPGNYGTLTCDASGNYTYTLDNENSDVKSLNNDQTLSETFNYTIIDGYGGIGNATLFITIAGFTDLKDFVVSKGFSPDGNGINDYFVIAGIENLPDNELSIYNRWGSLVYHKKNYKNEWNGRSAGKDKNLPVGTYFYILKVNGKVSPFKGYLYIKY